MPTELQRKHAAGIMRWLIANEPAIHYKQRRPMVTRGWTEQQTAALLAAGGSFEMDCSEAATFVCRLAGLADPNGAGYDGSGYTGTMLANLPHYVNPAAAGVGALVVFGTRPGHHVAQVLEPGADPLLFWHGSDRGPYAVRLSLGKKSQPSPVTFLSIAAL